MPNVDCGIDIGSTNLKIVFVEEGGVVLLTRTIPTPRTQDNLGPVTDPLALVAKLEEMIITGWRGLKLQAPLRSIAAAGIGEDGMGLDSEMRPIAHAIPWFDRRAMTEAADLRSGFENATRTGQELNATLSASKWLWLHRHHPEQGSSSKVWITLTDFPAVHWSGNPFHSISLAPRTGCFDIYGRQWIPELLALCHAPPLPDVWPAGAILGGVRRGPLRDSGAASSETVVAVGGHDHPVGAAVIRHFDKSARIDSMGTASLIYGEIPPPTEPLRDKDLVFSVPPAGTVGLVCLGINEWGDRIKDPAQHDALNSEARQQLRAMQALGVPPGKLYAVGGISRNLSFLKMRATAFAEPFYALGDLELTGLGAAMFGALAAAGRFTVPFGEKDITIVAPERRA